VLELIQEFKNLSDNSKDLIMSADKLPSDTPDVVATLNNNLLLVDCLIKIFKEDKTTFLPTDIPKYIRQCVDSFKESINAIKKEPEKKAEHIKKALHALDSLYAHCLKYGLITFGFDGKEEIKIVQDLRNKINDAETGIIELKKELTGYKEKISLECQSASEKLKRIERETIDNINGELNKFKEKTVSIAVDLGQYAADYKNDLEQEKKNAENLISEIATQRDSAKQIVESCTKQVKDISDAHASANQKLSEITNFSAQASLEFENVQAHAQNAAAQLQVATQSAADAKAKDEAAAQHLANAKQRQQEINAFYQEIETHKDEMIEYKKQAEVNYNKLKADCNETVKKFTEDAKNIIKNNKDQQEKIDELLHKAVSAGLFGVFKVRQKFLVVTRFILLGGVLVSAIVVAIGVAYIAHTISNSDGATFDKAFFIRTALMVPLVYLLYFAGAQYKKERQAEEEYAFKSAISFSLEPYRNLLLKMKNDGENEAGFVKQLMEDIFDNPVKRLFKYEEKEAECEEVVNLVSNVMEKMPSGKKKILADALQKLISE
jgi:chromosome segregation ATPase